MWTKIDESSLLTRFEFEKWIWDAPQIRQEPVLIERRLKSWKINNNFKWNQP